MLGAPSIPRSLRNGWDSATVHFDRKQQNRKRSRERFSNTRTLNKIEKGGFYFHPSDEDLSPDTPDGKATGQSYFRSIAIGERL